MKKIISILLIAIGLSSFGQVAIKSIQADTATGLSQRIYVNNIFIDADSKKVIIGYKIQTLSPNGKVANPDVVGQKTYVRWNQPNIYGGINGDSLVKPLNFKFDTLQLSTVGLMIKGMVLRDFIPINSIADLPKLEQ